MLGTGYFLKSQKLIPAKHKQSPIRKNFVLYGIRWKNDRSFDQSGPGRYFWFLNLRQFLQSPIISPCQRFVLQTD